MVRKKLTMRKILAPSLSKWTLGIAFALLVIAWVMALWRVPQIVGPGAVIPLHYNIYFGVDYIGAWWQVLLLPGFATLVLLVNTFFATRVSKDQEVLANIMHVMAVFVALLVDIALFFIILINV